MGFEPRPKLLAERLDVKESEVIEMDQRLGSWEVSLDAPVKEDSDSDHQSFIPSDDVGADEQLAETNSLQISKGKNSSRKNWPLSGPLYLRKSDLFSTTDSWPKTL
jgi:DNA-directed RNA polymerase sigma subunit (sigma70/sigma32)